MDGGENGGGETVEFNSEAAPGDSARSFLSDRQYEVLRVEMDYMEGYRPTQAAYDSLTAELGEHLDKSAIGIGPESSIPARDSGRYTASEVRDLEAEYRDHYTRAKSDTLWAYILVLDGKFAGNGSVVGIAYFNTSMAFFGQTIDEISGGLTQPSREKVEATAFRHEFGHNLGLVNNGTPLQSDHHDEANGAHCTNEQCVMYHTIETTDFFASLVDRPIPDFESFCTEDMAARR